MQQFGCGGSIPALELPGDGTSLGLRPLFYSLTYALISSDVTAPHYPFDD